MTQPVTNTGTAGESASARQILSFVVESETYGVDILRVREIRGFSTVTPIPESPGYMLGVLNLRGAIVPVVDMRRRIGLAAIERTSLTVIIVLSIETARGRRDYGLVVDGVSDVIDLAGSQIKSAPATGTTASASILQGLATVGERMVLLLDIDRLLNEELLQLQAA